MSNYFFTDEGSDKKVFKEQIQKTLDVLEQTYDTPKCYKGALPEEVKKEITSIDVLPDEGMGFDKALNVLKEKVLPYMVFPPSKTYMAHLHSPALSEGVVSELIIGAYNQSMDSWDQGPAATNVEIHVINKLCSLFGFNNGDGAITSGGSQSNLTALFLARDAKLADLGFDAKHNALGDWSKKLVCYTSEISHFSFDKASHLLGLGYNAVRHVKTDSCYRMDINDLRNKVETDIKNGLVPFAVVATVGTTDFGSIDPLVEIHKICSEYGMYMHSDAAYGSALIMSSKYKNRISGIEYSDSITIDFHKMFLLPISCSAIIVKNKNYLDPLSFRAVYLNREEEEELGYENLVSKGLQTTRRFDSLKVLFSFMVRGAKGFDEIISKSVENAEYLYEKLKNDSDFETFNKPEISAVIFRYVGSSSDLNNLNKNIRHALMHMCGIFIGETETEGKTTLKTTLLNPRTEKKDLDELVCKIKEFANKNV
ncbi:MAG: aspartate aminotransferase family protein [Sphaerochaetaceae bacterium]|nr:aspartate aminotransferase family protein [Spirochaetales bacterium]MDY5968244.1 aspartate aminotransferase family protein [Sphaerochaetaceae bacterium]